LRERPREIALLARRFLDEENRAGGGVSAAAMERLTSWSWPGNVRELRNVMRYAAALAEEGPVELWHLPPSLAPDAEAPDPPAKPAAPVAGQFRPIADEIRDLERRRMVEALEAADGVQKRAAELIAMPLRTFRLKSGQYGIPGRKRS
jgi:DNA-binding NtrC family response regulator